VPVSFVIVYALPIHSVIDRKEHEKYLHLPLYGNTDYSLMIACAPLIDESQGKGERVITLNFTVVQHFIGV